MTTYAGARSRLTERAARVLPSRRFLFQPKIDGAYCTAITDGRGFLRHLLSRTGQAFGAADVDDLIGVQTGHRDAVLIGELECHTPVGVAARESRGFPLLHLYDAARLSGVPCHAVPYSERLARLFAERSRAEVEHVDQWEPAHGGRYRERSSGQFDRKHPRDHRRLPIVECSRDFGELWQRHVLLGGGEGLVAVRVDASLGARGAKRKIKPTDTFSATLVGRDTSAALLDYRGVRFVVSARAAWARLLSPADVVDFACDGWTMQGQPRNPRMIRPRPDLTRH